MTVTFTEAELAEMASQTNSRVSRLGYRKAGTIVKVVNDTLKGSEQTPAWYLQNTGDVYLSLPAIFKGDDRKMTAAVRSGSNRELLDGFLAHEAAHSAWSEWMIDMHMHKDEDGKPHSPAIKQVCTMFEELRIEKRAADKGARDWLRQSFKWLLETAETPTSKESLAGMWALIYGRYLSGIARRDEIVDFDSLFRATMGSYESEIMEDILSEAIEMPISLAAEKLPGLAREWLEMLDIDPDASSAGPTVMVVCSHPEGHGDEAGEGGGGSGEGEEGEGGGGGGKPGEAGDQEGSGTGDGEDGDGDEKVSVMSGGHGWSPIKPEAKELIKRAIEALSEVVDKPYTPKGSGKDLADARKMAAEVFGGKRGGWEQPPVKDDFVRASRLARQLERLSLPAVRKVEMAQEVPPGRLRSREMVRRGAERSMGRMTTATPWERTKRTRTTSRPVIVGCMTDTSGSMAWAQQFVADFAWVVARAGVHVGARTAAVTFGDRAKMVHKPGEKPNKKIQYNSDGGSEAFDHGAAALDGVLHLSANNGAAKVLFVVSDGALVRGGESERAKLWIEKFAKAGTMTVWVGCESSNQSLYKHPSVTFVNRTSNYDQLYKEMEQAVLRAARGMEALAS